MLFAFGIHLLAKWVAEFDFLESDRVRMGMLVVFLLVYALLIAVPFVPGVEIGLALMVMEGPWIAPLIYVATVLGLSLAYAAGELMPYARLHRLFEDLRLRRACNLLEMVAPLGRAQRLDALREWAPA